MSVATGRLTRVAVREVWRHEARNFTTWLLENADVLGECLGMELELTKVEHAVGGFSLDLLGSEVGTDAVVIVENQLEESDHTHLGQILTYAGGTDAHHVVWVAPSFRPEHREALEWLNQRTDSQTRFFAVRIEAVRIGDSPAAPLMSLVVQPNDWGKAVRRSSARQAGKQLTREDFLNQIEALHGQRYVPLVEKLFDQHEQISDGSYLWYGAGVTGMLPVGGMTLHPWALYADPHLRLSVNFAWIHKNGQAISEEGMERFAAQLADLPGFKEASDSARASGWNKRPGIAAAPILETPGAVDRITEAVRGLHELVEQHDDSESRF